MGLMDLPIVLGGKYEMRLLKEDYMKDSVKNTHIYQVFTEASQLMSGYALFLNKDPSAFVLYDNIEKLDEIEEKLGEALESTRIAKGNLLEFMTTEVTSVNS